MNEKWERLLPKTAALLRAPPDPREKEPLGTEAWLGLMVILGVLLGVIYAKITLP